LLSEADAARLSVGYSELSAGLRAMIQARPRALLA